MVVQGCGRVGMWEALDPGTRVDRATNAHEWEHHTAGCSGREVLRHSRIQIVKDGFAYDDL
jgi:hypothetical protein